MNREQITKLAQQFGLMMRDEPMHGVESLAKAAYAAGAAAEREALIALADDMLEDPYVKPYISAIRARG